MPSSQYIIDCYKYQRSIAKNGREQAMMRIGEDGLYDSLEFLDTSLVFAGGAKGDANAVGETV